MLSWNQWGARRPADRPKAAGREDVIFAEHPGQGHPRPATSSCLKTSLPKLVQAEVPRREADGEVVGI